MLVMLFVRSKLIKPLSDFRCRKKDISPKFQIILLKYQLVHLLLLLLKANKICLNSKTLLLDQALLNHKNLNKNLQKKLLYNKKNK